MGNGNRTNGGDFQSVKPFECDVGLGLNTVESSSSYPYKKMNYMSNSELYGNTNQFTSGFCSKSATDRVMGISGKVLFTANQWQELERQTMIYKYIMASVPVPPHLLLPLSTQSNRVSSGLRFSNGSDPEPWRCRRTDGKKWRCAKDVAPDQKYCERHAHKTRSRSRKPVEIKDNNNPTIISPANQQNRCNNDWLMKNGATASATPVSQLNNQFHFQPSIQPPNSGSKRDYKQDFTGNHENKKSYFDANDVWSRIGGGDHRDDCSLTLSMQSGGGFDHESFEMAVGMLNGDNRGVCGDVFKPTHQWLTHGSWTGSTTPGGPLGEALCLGITSTENLDQNESSSHGYNDSGITNSSSFDGFH